MIPFLNHQQVKSMTNDELRTLINELANELAYRAENNLSIREKIIKKAIKDIEDLKFSYDPFGSGSYYRIGNDYHNVFCKVQFVENREKRTVVALLRCVTTNLIISKGIAKCHKDDCFNIHIGRAIALRYALGLKVPEEYLNTPQPTDVKAGDIVEGYSLFSTYKEKVVKVTNDKCYYEDGYWDWIKSVKVIDDSDRHYKE